VIGGAALCGRLKKAKSGELAPIRSGGHGREKIAEDLSRGFLEPLHLDICRAAG